MSKTNTPATPVKPIKKYPNFYRLYLSSLLGGWKKRPLWKEVQTVSFFVGYPRTGASMMGALLDAHPNMVFAQELNLIRAHALGFSKYQILALILQSSERFVAGGSAGQGHVVGSKYSYAVPDQWQGRHRGLLVIGDKQAPGATANLTDYPHLAARFAQDLGKRVRMIHMIRNPFDCINGIFRLKSARSGRRGHTHVRQSIDYYLRLLGGIVELKRRHPDDILDIRMEDLIANPREKLVATCEFLGVPCPTDYLESCASIIFPEPRRSTSAVWTAEEIALIEATIAATPFLQGYEAPQSVRDSQQPAPEENHAS